MIQLSIYPAAYVAGRDFDDETMIISIVSPNVVHPNIYAKHVHQFHFHDITETYMIQSGIVEAMRYEIAELIAEAACNHLDKKRFVIHCEAGISRSPGVAMGLARYIDMNPNANEIARHFPHYNLHVCRLVQRAMRIKMKG